MTAFVGRADEIAALTDVAGNAVRGHVAALLVVGDPGSGKSRLLAEGAARAHLPRTLRVVGYEPESDVPLAAASDLLRSLTEVSRQASRLDTLVFEPRREEASPLEPLQVFEAAHRALGPARATLVLVDDLQWVDDLSLALCHYLVRAAETSGQPLALIAATRPSPNATSFVESLSQVLPAERVRVLELGPLTRDEAVELVAALAPALGGETARKLAEKSRGSPFWVEALVRSGGGDVDAGRLVTSRLRYASADGGALLALLTIAARPLSLADVCDLNGWEVERAKLAARELVVRGIAVEAGPALQLAHDLVRTAAACEIPDEGRRALHQRLGDWLAANAGTDIRRLREAVGHRHAAGLASLDLAWRLVQSPQRRLLGADGVHLLGSIADDADPFDADVLALQEAVASLAAELAEHEDALDRWFLIAERAQDPARRASALLAAARAAYGLDRVADARELLEHSRRIDDRNEVLRLEQDTHESAILLWLEQRLPEGQALAREAVTAATGLAARSGGVTALGARARHAYIDALRLDFEAAIMRGDREAALRAAEEREAAARGLDVESHLTASLALCLALRQNGRVREALTRARHVWAESQRRVLPRLIVDTGFLLARTLAFTGDLIEAEIVVGDAADVAARAGDVPRARHRLARQECAIAFERGRPRDALRRLEATDEPNEHQRIMLHGDLALWHARLDGSASAPRVMEQISRGNECADAVGCRRCTAELLLFSAEALARIDRREDARATLAAWDALDVRDVIDDLLGLHVGALAELDAATRAAELDAAAAAGESSAFGLVTLWIRLDLGRELAVAGDDRAIAELERVVALAFDRGASTVAELAEQVLRRLGVRTWRRGAATTPLSEREQEIVRLIAAGASNPEIAQALFLSRKTVERHVSNVLRKVGARNRAELVARVADLNVEGAHR